MRILLAHNRYQLPGGEDFVFATERDLLRAHGHDVVTYERSNHEIGSGLLARIGAARHTLWAHDSARDIDALIREHRPEVAHFTNTFPLISPAAYAACMRHGVPVVQSVHNFRLVCLNAYLLRDGRICEDCVGRPVPWPGVVHRCYRRSASGSLTVAAMLSLHRAMGTWQHSIALYIALSETMRAKLIEGGLPADRIAVKTNFLPTDPGPKTGREAYALFVGRLEAEKGLETLLEAWRLLPDVPLRIYGMGPLEAWCRAELDKLGRSNIEFVGHRPHDEIIDAMNDASLLVFPSRWYEGCPMTMLEAMARGLPIVASRLGGMAELVSDEETGLLFEPSASSELASRVASLWAQPELRSRLGRAARSRYLEAHLPERHHELLMDLYRRAQQITAGA